MYKIKDKNWIVVLMAIISMAAFTACGGDDENDDGNIPGTDEDTELIIGVHRIDVHFGDNAYGCSLMTSFTGVKADGGVSKLYENGKQLELEDNVLLSREISDYSISTEKTCWTLRETIFMAPAEVRTIDHDVTVTLVAYVNDKRIKTQVCTFPKGYASMYVPFSTDDTELWNVILTDEDGNKTMN